MKKLINRFALLAVLGSLICGALVAGCGGGGGDEDAGTPAATPKKDKGADEAP